MEQLIANLTQAGLIDGAYIRLDDYQMVETSDFVSHFGEALSGEDKYASLVAADDNGDGTSKGYKRFFDAWLEAGILETIPA